MRIGINCLTIDPSYIGGINTYALGLLHGFARQNSTHQFNLYVTKENRNIFHAFENSKGFALRQISKFDSPVKKQLLHQIALRGNSFLYKTTADIFYSRLSKIMSRENDFVYFPNTILSPFNYSRPTLLSMHDIQQVHFPEFFSKEEIRMRKIAYNLSAKHAGFMQASSEFIREDFLRYFKGLTPERVPVINEGVDVETFSKPKNTEEIFRKYKLPEAFLFFPAQLWHHKNHITVLKALLILREKHALNIPLVLSGAPYSSAELITNFINENKMTNVFYLGKVPFDDLLALYQAARFMITAVLYESSSLPILEAVASNTPVIVSATPPNVEMHKNLRLNFFDPYDSFELAELLRKIWDDTELRKNQMEFNRGGIIFYSWDNAAKRYLDFFEKVSAENRVA
jgi:glycosyltransferase involved in cell wall biosynthesis